MKKLFSSVKASLSFAAALIIAVAIFLPAAAAGPSQPAPNGNNVDAVFNSVNIGAANKIKISNAGIDISGFPGGLSFIGGGSVTFNQEGDIYAANGDILSAAGKIATLGGGDIISSGNASVAGKLNVDGNASMNNALVNESANNGGAVKISDDVTVTGHTKSTGGFGKFKKRKGNTASMAPGKYGVSIATCPAPEYLTGCGFDTSGDKVEMQSIAADGDAVAAQPKTCTGKALNSSGLTLSMQVHAICFAPGE